MKRFINLLAALLLIGGSTGLRAQFVGASVSGSAGGPRFSADLLKLFGEHKTFSANLEFQIRMAGADKPTMLPGTIAFSNGKARFEMDLTQAKGGQIPPERLAQLRQMRMDKVVTISLPDKELSYLIYPGLEAYVQLPLNDPDAKKPDSDFTMKITELGKEEIGGHDCVKNKVVVTDKDGKNHESTVWNAVDLKQFPVKIQTAEEGHEVVMVFTNVKLSQPAADQFVPPAAYKKYDSFMGMMQEIMMKRMGAGNAGPPAK